MISLRRAFKSVIVSIALRLRFGGFDLFYDTIHEDVNRWWLNPIFVILILIFIFTAFADKLLFMKRQTEERGQKRLAEKKDGRNEGRYRIFCSESARFFPDSNEA